MVLEINAYSPDTESKKEPQSAAIVVADALMALAFCVCVSAFVYYAYYYNISGRRYFANQIGVIVYQIAPVCVALLLLAISRLPPASRVNAAVLLVATAASIYGAESFLRLSPSMLSPSRTLWGDAHFNESERREIHALANAFNTEFDTRSRLEIIRELRTRDISAVPSIIPLALLKEQEDGGMKSRIDLDGREVLPLGGISDRVTVLCNETGRYSIYRADERGFHNPAGIWASRSMAVAAVGDSFTHGACVPSDRNFVALIRGRYSNTLNLGMSGEGPLLMLAAITEYLPVVKPKTVLWFFYEQNDFVELGKESRTALLRRYVDGGFSQELFSRQAEIDDLLTRFVEQEMGRESAKRREEGKVEEESGESRYRWQVLLDVIKLSRLRETLGLVYGRAAQDVAGSHSQGRLDLFHRALLQAKHLVEGWGGKLYFVYLPARDRYAHAQDYNRQKVMKVVEETGIPIIDIHAAFQRESDPMRLFPFGRFGHYNEAGNRVVADEVLRVISAGN
jgi:hypothetical protein